MDPIVGGDVINPKNPGGVKSSEQVIMTTNPKDIDEFLFGNGAAWRITSFG
ncbi:hypothetical protein [Achromobacter sp. MFA1 R4]|uniref:hypothetical protein n=1 Tax=Achromobacter sp. MFA1 R4 TaxID=1881016 RepID=UPI0012EB7095|nr:hypothetical protein [Achromobacter sp. MFA1 R4]